MYRITNKQRGPVQIVVRSRVHNGGFTTLNIPGVGAGKNFYNLDDELMTDFVTRVKEAGLITVEEIINEDGFVTTR